MISLSGSQQLICTIMWIAFLGTEIVAVTVGEARNPRRAVPRAIRRVFFRIVTFYILGIFVISLIVPYNDPRLLSDTGNAASSPFTIAVSNAGIKVLPSIVNAIVLIAAWSAANSDVVSIARCNVSGKACG
jgi:amino acid transporter